MSTLINRILSNLTTRIMLVIYLSFILITAFFIAFGYFNELELQQQRQYDKLRAAVSALAINIDGDSHAELIEHYEGTPDGVKMIAEDTMYHVIRDKLRSVVEDNELNSPMYTLVYNEKKDFFYYGVRSDNFIDFKNKYIQSPEALKENLEHGGILPIYQSENGTWISAFHPIRNRNGEVVALLEADLELTEFKTLVNDSYLEKALISLGVIAGLSFFLILYARKILVKDEKQKKLFLEQKRIIESKNKDITDSIRYALKIQSAMLPSLKILEENGLDGFVLHQAKDIVAGDFYWIEKHDNYLFFAVADCTGHGVPGAILSMLCSNALNRVVDSLEIRDTGKILETVREIIIKRLGEGDEIMHDGMDISLCRLDLDTNEIMYSGANNPLYIFSKESKEIILASPDKQPVGEYPIIRPFKSQTFQLSKGDLVYLFSDGFADQFGGPKGKKFKDIPFRKLLQQNAEKPLQNQLQTLRKTFREWRMDTEQIDDVCVMGVRI